MQNIREDKDFMRQFPRRPRFGVRLPSILKLELRWFNRYHLLNLTVYTRIAKQIYNRILKMLNVASTPCSLIQGESSPSIVVDRHPIPAPLLNNPQFFKPSARLISTTKNRTRILPFNITESATRLTKTSSSQSPSLSWKLMKNSSKNPQTQTSLGGQNPKGFIQEKTCRKLQPEPDSPITASNLITFNQSQSTSKMVVCNWCVVRCWRWRWRILDTYFTFSCSLNTWIKISKC